VTVSLAHHPRHRLRSLAGLGLRQSLNDALYLMMLKASVRPIQQSGPQARF